MIRVVRVLSAMLCIVALCAVSASASDWPASVVGTWKILGNLSPGTLVISHQGQGIDCVAISGTIYQTDLVEGFYCPATGRISFLRKTASNIAFQVWTGNLSQAGGRLWMGGTMASENDRYGGDVGEYNFSASQ